MHDELGARRTRRSEINELVVERMAERYRASLPLLPGAVEAVERLAARWPLGLASSSNRQLIELVLELGRAGAASSGPPSRPRRSRAASRRRTSTSRPHAASASTRAVPPPSRTPRRASARRLRPGCAWSRSRTARSRRARRRSPLADVVLESLDEPDAGGDRALAPADQRHPVADCEHHALDAVVRAHVVVEALDRARRVVVGSSLATRPDQSTLSATIRPPSASIGSAAS